MATNKELQLQHLFDGTDWNVYNADIVNLGVGAPGSDLLENCCTIFGKATEHRLKIEKESNSSFLFQYGSKSGPIEARTAIASYLCEAYGDEVRREDLLITSGATQGLHVLLSTLVDLDGFIFVDEVSYMIALDTIKQFTSLQIVPVRLNEDGVDLQDLERLLVEKQRLGRASESKEFWAMYYTIPVYHNPTGILFSAEVCRGLISLARKYDVLIACDDVYNILKYSGEEARVPRRLFAYDSPKDSDYRGGNVVSNGSFSKTIAPGIRLGWLESPARVKDILDSSGILNSGGCLNNYMAGMAASLFELGLGQQHIKHMYKVYMERMLAMCEVLRRELPAGCVMHSPQGGYFIWITLPPGRDAKELQQFCMSEEKIFFIVGERFAAGEVSPKTKASFRLSIAFQPKERLVDAAHRLCAAIDKFLKLAK